MGSDRNVPDRKYPTMVIDNYHLHNHKLRVGCHKMGIRSFDRDYRKGVPGMCQGKMLLRKHLSALPRKFQNWTFTVHVIEK